MANLLNEWPLSFVNAKLLCSTFVSIQFHYISVNECFVEKRIMYEKIQRNHREALKNILIVTILMRSSLYGLSFSSSKDSIVLITKI